VVDQEQLGQQADDPDDDDGKNELAERPAPEAAKDVRQ
jgi:hypothetical protein